MGGRPPKIFDKLSHCIKVKLTEIDYVKVMNKAENVGIKPAVYAREMVLNGYVKSPLTEEQMGLMRILAGIANNLNQFLRHLNAGEMKHKLAVMELIIDIKKIINDCKKY